MAKLGSKENPIIVNVHSEALAERISRDVTDRGMHFIMGMNVHDPENIQDYEAAMGSRLREELGAASALPPPEPYDPCPCGSGKKYKFCCKKKK